MKPTEILKNQENYTEKEAAQWLKISRATLQRARYRSEISYFRLGNNRIVYARRHLEDYCSRRETVNNLRAVGANGIENSLLQIEAVGINNSI